MSTIRVVRGSGHGPTEIAAYDAALADAGVHNYNLTHVSSVIPTGSVVEMLDSAPNLGPIGEKLTVVEARATSVSDGTDAEEACAGLGWTVENSGRGLFYEAVGTDPETVREDVAAGLESGRSLREWSFTDERIVTESVEGGDRADEYATAVVLGIYGESDPIL